MNCNSARIILLSTLMVWTVSALAQPLLELSKNPFSQPEILNQKTKSTNRAVNTTRTPSNEMIPTLRLSATLISIQQPMAMVNDRLLQIGEQIEGMTLILVDEGRALFRYQGKTYEYTIDQPDSPQFR